MTIETFPRIKVSSQPTEGSKDTVRKVQFGDGYAQVSGSGLNDEIRTYEYSFSGDPTTANEIHAFLRRHKVKSFIFTPPFGDTALLWRVEADTLKKVVKNVKVITVTATFEQAFAP
ncbi:phage tail protein [Escherichia coli]|uniref:phage tail protein n=1 Tax=Escherichia coli TaxID=562 RepID=UPI00388E4EDD